MSDVCPQAFPLASSVGAGGPHDVGGSRLAIDGDGTIDRRDHALAHWELCTHALLVQLSSRSPALMTTDELRRAVEALPEDTYAQWGYYEKWAAAMATILLERGAITAEEFDHELYGDEEETHSHAETHAHTHTHTQTETLTQAVTPRFREGDLVRVRREDSRLRWRRPHLRCPGYIFGLTGRVEKYMGTFADPSALAFRGKAPAQPLYVVKFLLRDTWATTEVNVAHAAQGEKRHTVRDFEREDCVTAEIYQGWLESVTPEEAHDHTEHDHTEHAHNDEEHVHKKAKCEHSACESHEHSHEHAHAHTHHDDHTHEHSHSHDGDSHAHSHAHCESHTHGDADTHAHAHAHSHEEDSHTHDHAHGHTHESRERVEQVAVEREGVSPPGMTVALALLRLLKRKQIVTAEALQKTAEALQNNGVKMLGAELVVHAWKDPAFKERLLTDASSAAAEFGINTSNPNAPTILRVVANTPTTHHVIVCTLCSCYPAALLGLSPAWYKSRNYRARVVREPRVVLKEFGVELPENVSIELHDSTADLRYMVIPMPPASLSAEDIANKSVEELKKYVTRDSMIGVALL